MSSVTGIVLDYRKAEEIDIFSLKKSKGV